MGSEQGVPQEYHYDRILSDLLEGLEFDVALGNVPLAELDLDGTFFPGEEHPQALSSVNLPGSAHLHLPALGGLVLLRRKRAL